MTTAAVAVALVEEPAACALSREFVYLVDQLDEYANRQRRDRSAARETLRIVRDAWCERCPIWNACEQFARADVDHRFQGVAAGRYWRDGVPWPLSMKRVPLTRSSGS